MKYILNSGIYSLLMAAFLALTVYPQNFGEITVKTWPDDRKAAFSFTFDDGLLSQSTNAKQILEQFGFRGSFYFVTSTLTEQLPGVWRYGSWNEFTQMAANGHEVGSHTVTHLNLTNIPAGDTLTEGTILYELYRSAKKIQEKIPFEKAFSIAYPFTAHNQLVDSLSAKFYLSGRGGGNNFNNSSLTGLDYFKLKCKENYFNLPRNSPEDDLDELNDFIAYTQSAIDQGKWAMLLAHEVVPFSEIGGIINSTWYPMSNEWLTALCQWLYSKSSANEIWVETTANVTKYIRQRESFLYQLIAQNDSTIKFIPADTLDNLIYNLSLTVDVLVPSDWEEVIFQQGSVLQTLNTLTIGQNTFARINIIPDGGEVTLLKKTTANSFAVTGNVLYHNSQNTPVENVLLVLSRQDGVQFFAESDENGSFTFPSILSGTYNLSISKNENWGGVNSTDALFIMKGYSSQLTLDSLQTAAADVNNDGFLTFSDAEMVMKRFSRLINSFAGPDWIFSLNNSQIIVSSSNINLNVEALTSGDVNKSYIPQ
ncbi:MAG: polysaccharide deacetylase family protein [Ignavibacteriaceae bacterium]|nr:polysaccharide deacetylase family protein [Ignavibacteriaceae bacterium]